MPTSDVAIRTKNKEILQESRFARWADRARHNIFSTWNPEDYDMCCGLWISDYCVCVHVWEPFSLSWMRFFSLYYGCFGDGWYILALCHCTVVTTSWTQDGVQMPPPPFPSGYWEMAPGSTISGLDWQEFTSLRDPGPGSGCCNWTRFSVVSFLCWGLNAFCGWEHFFILNVWVSKGMDSSRYRFLLWRTSQLVDSIHSHLLPE